MTVFDLDELVLKNRRLTALTNLRYRKSDRLQWPLRFLQDESFVELPVGASLSVGVKRTRNSNSYLALATSPAKTGTGSTAIYTFDLNLNTEPVSYELSDKETIDCVLEVEIVTPTQRLTSQSVPLVIERDVIANDPAPVAIPDLKATQAEAEAGTDNGKWMTPFLTAQAIAALAGGGSFILKQASFQAESGKRYLVGVSPDGGGTYGADDAEGTSNGSGGSVGSAETEIIITLPDNPDEGAVCVFAPNRFMWEDFTHGGEHRARTSVPVKVVAPEGFLINGFESELSLGSEMQIVWAGGSTGWLVVDRALCRFRGTNDNGPTQYFDQGDQHEISFGTDYDPLNGFSPQGTSYTIPAAGVWQFNVMAFMWSPPGAVFELTLMNNWQQIGRFHAPNIGDACQALFATGVYCRKGDTIRVLGRVWGTNGHIAGDPGVGFFEGHLI